MRIIKTSDIKLIIGKDTFKKAEPVLWFNAGLYCVIPKPIIQNALENLDMCQKLVGRKNGMNPSVYVTWDQGIPINPKAGYALLGEL